MKEAIKLGTLIREEREKQGLSRHDLSIKCDVTADHLGKIERGETLHVRVETLGKIAAALGQRIVNFLEVNNEDGESEA